MKKIDLDYILATNKANKPILNSSIIIKTSMKGIYSKPELLSDLLDTIGEHIHHISLSYNKEVFQIEIKIKKTAMKDVPNFSHTVDFYYKLFATIFRQFIDKNIEAILDMISIYYPDQNPKDIDIYENIFLLFNITIVGDNIVYLHL